MHKKHERCHEQHRAGALRSSNYCCARQACREHNENTKTCQRLTAHSHAGERLDIRNGRKTDKVHVGKKHARQCRGPAKVATISCTTHLWPMASPPTARTSECQRAHLLTVATGGIKQLALRTPHAPAAARAHGDERRSSKHDGRSTADRFCNITVAS